MRVKAIQSFKLRGELVSPGKLLDVPEAALEKLADKVEPVEAPVPSLDYIVSMKTKTGRDIYVVTSERLRRLAPKDKPVFGPGEIEQIRGLPAEQVEAIINVKESFHDALVEA